MRWKVFLQVLLGSTLCKLCKVHLCLKLSDVQKSREWVETSSGEMRNFELRLDDMKIAKKNLADIWEDMKWDEKSSDEMSWDEVQVWSASVKVKSAVWSVRKVFAWRCIAPGSCTGHVLGQQHCNSFAQSTHARAWLAHGACKFLNSSTGKRFMKAQMTYEKRWDENRWAGIRWEELRWDEVWSVKSAVLSVGREECRVKCGVWSVKCGVWRVQWEVWRAKWSFKCDMFRRMHARTGLAGARHVQVL